MKRNEVFPIILKCVFFAVPLLAAVSVFLYGGAVLFDYETGISNYFESGSLLHPIAAALAVLGVVASIVAAVFRADGGKLSSGPDGYALLPVGIGFLLAGIMLFSAPEAKTWLNALFHVSSPAWLLPTLLILSGIACIQPLTPLQISRDGCAALLFLPLIVLVDLESRFYFDTATEMNAPVKVLVMTGLLAALLFLTTEIRRVLGIALPRLSAFTVLAALVLSSVSSLPLILGFLTDRFSGADLFAGAVLNLGFLLSAILRFLPALCKEKPDGEKTAPNDTESEEIAE